ncbi:MAG TPA: VOC family protein [Chthoniobacterales bacterium]|nr:VOC family protein [Chthoniobacterales bacterium]
MDLNQVTLPAMDVAASVVFYKKMGFEIIVESPHYARFKSSVGDATFSVHAVNGTGEPSKTIVYFECPLLDEQVAALQAKGIEFTQEPRDEPWLWREARLLDPAGNVICLYHAGENRLNPPWRVKA